MGQQFAERNCLKFPVPPGNQDPQIRGKLIEHLAAGAAGPAVVRSPAGDGDGHPVLPVSLADRFQQGGALGAEGVSFAASAFFFSAVRCFFFSSAKSS